MITIDIKNFETDEEFIDFIIGFINGQEGEILDIEKIGDQEYKIYLEEGFYTLCYTFVYLSNWSAGPEVALFYEHGHTRNGHDMPSSERLLSAENVDNIFKAVNEIYKSNISLATKNSLDILSVITESFGNFDYFTKISNNVFTIKKGDKTFVLTRSDYYLSGILSHKFTIHSKNKIIAKFKSDTSAINTLFECFEFISNSSATDISEIQKITKRISDIKL